ncbi:hypothetical protein KJ359_012087 [Pestalotiopsis sp. 9143b]|nr:hypothetical protein KJ359_012087 [Pestalotiopsis sp. 9143b]
MSLVGTIYTTRYVKAGDLRYHGYVKEHYCGFRMGYPGLCQDLTVAVPSEIAKHLKKAVDRRRCDKDTAIQRALFDCVGEPNERGRYNAVLLDISQEEEGLFRVEHNVSIDGSLGPAFSNDTHSTRMFKFCDPSLTTVTRNDNGDTQVAFFVSTPELLIR